MRLFLQVAAALFGSASVIVAAAPPALTSLATIHDLTNVQASRGLPVAFEATVTYFRGYDHLLFVQDGDVAIFVRPPADDEMIPSNLMPGDRVLVRGTTQESFRPIVVGNNITRLYHGMLPDALPTNFDQLIRAQHDCMLVTVRGVVRAADMVLNSAAGISNVRLQLDADGGPIEADVNTEDELALSEFLDAEVQVTGTASGAFDNKMQLTKVRIHVSALDDIRILKKSSESLWSLPVTPMNQVLSSYHVDDLSHRVLVHGTITYYTPGSAIVLQNGNKSLWIATHSRAPLRVGDIAFATGFPDSHDGLVTLSDGEVKDSQVLAPVVPLNATWEQLAFWNVDQPNGHQFDLVSLEGEVVKEVRTASQEEIVLAAGDRLFTAIYRFPSALERPFSVMQVTQGARVRVTGICLIVDPNTSNKGHEVPFNILMRSADDIEVVAKPGWLNVQHLILVVGVLLLAIFAVSVRAWLVERRARREIVAIAYLERRRAKILEHINASGPLTETLEYITEMVSASLSGAPCWCQIDNGAHVGNCPPQIPAISLRVVERPIPSRVGGRVGIIFAAFAASSKPRQAESEVLDVAAGLATLAIETAHLYSNLVRRSEFDLLTGTENRFSLERFLEEQIFAAQRSGTIFGLLYVDLDRFKQVNDNYSHHVGDLYLQEVAKRMKGQLRPGDMLARLGGDEFAALVPAARSLADVEEIRQRLVRCFDEPFRLEDHLLRGSASIGIAMYPEDGITPESLLTVADAAMYTAKHSQPREETRRVAESESEVTSKHPA
ncbi:MAG: GGDEF domain-containing protein [Terracidiphilus sp.]